MPRLAIVFLRWAAMRAALHRGYWLVASLYLVIDAHLSPFELVFLGTAQGVTSFLFEAPTGVMADTVSRKWSLVISHVLIGASMIATGLVTAFPALVATQMLWGIGWTFASGSDVAWITDELRQPGRVAGVLTAQARMSMAGGACGMALLGVLAWLMDRGATMVIAGAAMTVAGLYVAILFPERSFVPTRTHRWGRSLAIFRMGLAMARRDRGILLVLAVTFLVNGAADAYGRLFPKRLVEIGMPGHGDPIVWFTGLGIVTAIFGAVVLRLVEPRVDGAGMVRRIYAGACGAGVFGLVVLAVSPQFVVAAVAVLLVDGVALRVTRPMSVIWLDRRVTSDVRATMQSFLSQAEYVGEIVIGVSLGLVASATSLTVTFLCSGTLFVAAAMLTRPADRRAPTTLEEAHAWQDAS